MHETLFPREVTTNLPRVTLTGCDQLHVEQHQGLVAYGPEEIVLRTAAGMLRITGDLLRFRLYHASEAKITGRIRCVGYSGEGGRP